MVEIPVKGSDRPAIVDDDMAWVTRWKWRLNPTGYPQASVGYLHVICYGFTPDGAEVDHRDRDTLNCRRANLRAATKSQNRANRRGWGSRTPHRNVLWNGRCFYVIVRKDGVGHYGGAFKQDAEAAARRADELMRELHGEFAVLNFPEEVGDVARAA